jgi:peptidoglycan hydrolase-like protein with peptidoglycan-binding domain
MPVLSYRRPGLVLKPSPAVSTVVRDVQHDLRSLGYLKSGIDGVFGDGTSRAVRALQTDLLINDGNGKDGTAPIAIRDVNGGRVTAVTGVIDQPLVECISDLLDHPDYPKLPFSSAPAAANAQVLLSIAEMQNPQVPPPFLIAILMQESGGKHYREPGAGDEDSFVVVGCDTNDAVRRDAITSRGYGIGQFTLFHHPPRATEVAGFIADPLGNIARSIRTLRDKFVNYVAGPMDTADDRIREVGSGPLRVCQYAPGDARYLRDCAACARNAGLQQIEAGVTSVFNGSPAKYARTQYHKGSYDDVPVRGRIPCDWPYAARRYNGSGVDSYDYQTEVLLRVLRLNRSAAGTGG